MWFFNFMPGFGAAVGVGFAGAAVGAGFAGAAVGAGFAGAAFLGAVLEEADFFLSVVFVLLTAISIEFDLYCINPV